MPVWVTACSPVGPTARLPSCLSACLSAGLLICLVLICLPVYLLSAACRSVCLSVCLPVGLSQFNFSELLALSISNSHHLNPLYCLFCLFFFVSIILVSSPQFLLRSMILARDQVSIFDNWGMCIPYVPWTCFEVLAPLAVNCPTLGVFYLVQRTACHWGDTEGLVMLCVWQSQSYSCGVLASWWIPEESHPGAKNVSSGRSSWVSHVALGGGRLEPF